MIEHPFPTAEDNKAKINRVALRALRRAKAKPNQESHYVVQLMRWALLNNKYQGSKKMVPGLLAALEGLDQLPVHQMEKVLLGAPDRETEPAQIQATNPEVLANDLLAQLESKISAVDPSFQVR